MQPVYAKMQTILGEQTLAFNCLPLFLHIFICQIIHPNYFISGLLRSELGPERTDKLNRNLYACLE